MTEDHVYEELSNICRHQILFPGDTISHATADECERRGWARRQGNGIVATQEGIAVNEQRVAAAMIPALEKAAAKIYVVRTDFEHKAITQVMAAPKVVTIRRVVYRANEGDPPREYMNLLQAGEKPATRGEWTIIKDELIEAVCLYDDWWHK